MRFVGALLLCFLSLAITSDGSLISRGHLILEKHISAPNTGDALVVGHPFLLTYNVLNNGDTDIEDVKIVHDLSASDVDIDSKRYSFEISRLSPGEMKSSSVSMVPLHTGSLIIEGASYEYVYESGGSYDITEREEKSARGISAALEVLNVISKEKYIQTTTNNRDKYTIAFIFSIAVILAPYFMFLKERRS